MLLVVVIMKMIMMMVPSHLYTIMLINNSFNFIIRSGIIICQCNHYYTYKICNSNNDYQLWQIVVIIPVDECPNTVTNSSVSSVSSSSSSEVIVLVIVALMVVEMVVVVVVLMVLVMVKVLVYTLVDPWCDITCLFTLSLWYSSLDILLR